MAKKLHFNELKADETWTQNRYLVRVFSILNLFCSLASWPEKSHRSLFEGPLFDMSGRPPECIGTHGLQSPLIRVWRQIMPTAHRMVSSTYIPDTGTPLIGRFLGPRKDRLNRNPSY